jgi:hypothetical protein
MERHRLVRPRDGDEWQCRCPGGIREHPLRGRSRGNSSQSIKLKPLVAVRMPSFVHLARMTRESGVAAVLPEIAKVDFDEKKIAGRPKPWKQDRQVAPIANARSLDRSGMRPGVVEKLAAVLTLG